MVAAPDDDAQCGAFSFVPKGDDDGDDAADAEANADAVNADAVAVLLDGFPLNAALNNALVDRMDDSMDRALSVVGGNRLTRGGWFSFTFSVL